MMWLFTAFLLLFGFNSVETVGASSGYCEGKWEMATDEDFGGSSDNNFRYIGNHVCVEIPHTIKGVSVTGYFEMFKDYTGDQLKGVKSTNKNIYYMGYMFYGASGLTDLDLSNFDTSKVTNMGSMFHGVSGLTDLDLSNFDTSKVTIMSYMFYGASGLTDLDLSNFDTSEVTNMYSMFNGVTVKVGYAGTQGDVDKFNASSGKPSNLYFVVKGTPIVEILKNGSHVYSKGHSIKVDVNWSDSSQELLQYVWSKSNNVPSSGWSNFTNGSTLTQSNGTGDYYLHIKAKSKQGIERVFTSEVFKLDNTAPKINLLPRTTSITHEDLVIAVTGSDSHSGVKSITYIGDNMVENGDFSEGGKNWNTQVGNGGKIRIEDGVVIFEDETTRQNKLQQGSVFKGTVKGVEYYAEIKARGVGYINTRYGKVSGGIAQNEYKQEIKDLREFKTHRFKMDRKEGNNDTLIIERVGLGYMEVSDDSLFEQKDITDSKQLEISDNGTYKFVVEDNAGNIATESYTVDNIDKTLSYEKPTVKEFKEVTLKRNTTKVETGIDGLVVKDWRDGDNKWKVTISASQIENKEGDKLDKGTMSLKGVKEVIRNNGSGDKPVVELQNTTVIDDGDIELVTSKDARGEYEIVFPKGALEVDIDPTKVKKGKYKSTLTWDLIQAP